MCTYIPVWDDAGEVADLVGVDHVVGLLDEVALQVVGPYRRRSWNIGRSNQWLIFYLNLLSWGDNNWYFFLKNLYFWFRQIKILCTISIWNMNSPQKLDKFREYLEVWIACHGGTNDSLKILISSFQNIEIAFLLIVSYVLNINNLLKWLR